MHNLFDLLKLKETPKEENEDVNFVNSEKEFEDRDFDFNSLSVEHREMFAICKYKYFLNRVLNEPIVYRNEFQIKYFLTNYIVQVVMDNELVLVLDLYNNLIIYQRIVMHLFHQLLY